jgi:hypothetical protein
LALSAIKAIFNRYLAAHCVLPVRTVRPRVLLLLLVNALLGITARQIQAACSKSFVLLVAFAPQAVMFPLTALLVHLLLEPVIRILVAVFRAVLALIVRSLACLPFLATALRDIIALVAL